MRNKTKRLCEELDTHFFSDNLVESIQDIIELEKYLNDWKEQLEIVKARKDLYKP